MGSRSHPHRVLSVCVCVCVSRCLWVCVIEADSRQLRVITVGLYLFLSRSLLCQILAVFAVVVYGPFWFRDSWALLLPGLRSPDLGCPLLPCATRLSPTESSASAYGSSASALRKAPLLPTEAPPLPYGKLRLVSRCVLLPVINSLSATESSRLHCDRRIWPIFMDSAETRGLQELLAGNNVRMDLQEENMLNTGRAVQALVAQVSELTTQIQLLRSPAAPPTPPSFSSPGTTALSTNRDSRRRRCMPEILTSVERFWRSVLCFFRSSHWRLPQKFPEWH